MAEELKHTPLYDWHVARGGRMVDFAGWAMPVQYEGVVAEHTAVRERCGLFDVSHMGRAIFSGPDAAGHLHCRVTVDVRAMPIGRAKYGLLCDASGGVIDDLLVTRLAPEKFLLVCNASNVEPVREAVDGGGQVDVTWPETAMLAVQGPTSGDVLKAAGVDGLESLSYYRGGEIEVAGHPAIASRGGYTGEDGYELIVPPEAAVPLAEALTEAGATPCGLGARDTLRLEAGMPLYGHELTRQIDPFAAGLNFAVRPLTGDDVGFEALLEKSGQTPTVRRVGLVFEGRRPVREGAELSHDGQAVGAVTSGTYSPTLGKPIAMAMVSAAAADVGTRLSADVRGTAIAGTVVELPFYKRPR